MLSKKRIQHRQQSESHVNLSVLVVSPLMRIVGFDVVSTTSINPHPVNFMVGTGFSYFDDTQNPLMKAKVEINHSRALRIWLFQPQAE